MRRIAGKMGMLAVAAAFVLQFQVVNCAEKTSAETVIEQETQIDVLQSSYAQPADATNNLAGRKFILLGDSYGDGWTPERMEVSWMTRIKNALGSENVYTCSEGGVGFCGYNSQRATYITLLQRLLPQIPDRNAITDIVPCGGLPDMRKNDAELIAGINNFVSYCRTMFPNARISYGAIGWGPTAYIQNFMVPKYNNVFSNIGALGIYNMPGAYTSLHGHPEWFSSDGNHPNGAGQQAIANNVIAHLLSTRYLVGPGYTGIAKYPIDGQWYYAENGMQDTSYNGLAYYQGDWYYVEGGVINWNYTGLANYGGTWYYVKNGVRNNEYTGIVVHNGDSYYVTNGVLNWGIDGAVQVGDTVYCLSNSTVKAGYTGLCMSEDKTWYYVEKGKLNANYTGLVYYGKDWYYVENGILNWGYNGFTEYYGTTYYVTNGMLVWGKDGAVKINETIYCLAGSTLNKSYTGLCMSADKNWYYVKNGVQDTSYTGLVTHQGLQYYVQDGCLNWGITGFRNIGGVSYYLKNSTVASWFNGIQKIDSTWICFKNGTVDYSYTGLFKGDDVWRYMKNGYEDTSYVGVCDYNGQTYFVYYGRVAWLITDVWYVQADDKMYYVMGGVVNWNYTNLVNTKYGWYYVRNGVVDTQYAGLVLYNGDWYYVQNGKIDWTFNGWTEYNGSRYYVTNGYLNWNNQPAE
ncbi:MAG: hypothetical protein KHZ67_06155 [Clostridiales bacterium]|nr:hypothetical protein [Clostridiales bacterium]